MVEQSLSRDSSSDHTLIRNRYIRFLTVTESTFAGKLGAEASRQFLRRLDYLHGRGVRKGMTFHNNENRMNMEGTPKPLPGAANLAHMELRMGAFCQRSC